jgi:hypothetical protein
MHVLRMRGGALTVTVVTELMIAGRRVIQQRAGKLVV